MNRFLTLTEAQRRTVFEQTAAKIKLPVPPENVREEWETDYDTMVMNMIYEDNVPSFADILGVVAKIENMFKA